MMPRNEVAKEGRDWRGYLLAAAVGAAGLLTMHHPMILSGMRRVQVDLGDSRLINYFLEHNYLWYRGEPGHQKFWDPPFFYPKRNVAAYSDTMLGIAPLYAAFRAVGLDPDSAFQAWVLAISSLNYAVMLHFLTKRLGLSVAAASIGAFLFAFGSPRANMQVQQTQLTQFLSLISIDALFGLFAGGMTSRVVRASAWIVAAGGMLAQLSSGYYPGWFTVLAIGIVAILAVWMPSTRGPFLATLRRDLPWIALAAIVAGLAIRPWLAHHLAAARELGPRWYQWVSNALPRPTSWLDSGASNWLGGWTMRITGLPWFRSKEHSLPLGIGLTTTAAALAGLWIFRHRPSTRLLATAGVVLAACLTLLPDWLVDSAKVALLLGPVAFAYDGRKDHPRTFLVLVGLVLLLLATDHFAGGLLFGCGLATLLIASSAIVARSDDRLGGLALGGLIVGLAWFLFPDWTILGVGIACGALVAAAGAVLGLRSRPKVEAMVIGGFLAFAVPVTFEERPAVWLLGLAAPIAALAARRSPIRPPSGWLPHLALVGASVEILFAPGGSAWWFFYIHIPGASSMIFVSRVGLILLIPAAIGLGYAIDALLMRRKPALALVLGLICLIEQGGSTPSFDKAANRQDVASLVRRIDARAEAFYYTPDGDPSPVRANLDAMWAGLALGKPTINGYSGHTPRGWRALDEPPGFGPRELRSLVDAWDEWKAAVGRNVSEVQWIGGPAERPARFAEAETEDAARP